MPHNTTNNPPSDITNNERIKAIFLLSKATTALFQKNSIADSEAITNIQTALDTLQKPIPTIDLSTIIPPTDISSISSIEGKCYSTKMPKFGLQTKHEAAHYDDEDYR